MPLTLYAACAYHINTMERPLMKRSIQNPYYLPFPIVPVLQHMHVTTVDASKTVYSMCSLHQHNGKASDEKEYSKPLLPAFPDCSSFTTHAHDNSK